MDGVGVGDVAGVSAGEAVGEDFFFRRGEPLGVGVAELFFFVVVGEGLGVGVGDFFFVAVDFFFRCGVGVGAANIFFNVCPSEGSAASCRVATKRKHMRKIKARKSM